MSKRVLITGISGFVGPYLAKALLTRNYEVYGLIKPRAGEPVSINLIKNNVMNRIHLIEADIRDMTSILLALDKSEPNIIFHLAAQSFVPRSFSNPLEAFRVNCLGTQNLLEAVRLKDLDCKIIFAGSSEEYGLQIASEKHYNDIIEKYGYINPEPEKIPELPINENNPLRPLSPYAVSKVYGDQLMRIYHLAYGLKTVVSRAFNHEGAGRGHYFVTSTIVRQCVKLNLGETDKIVIGNVNAFRDWSHVEDITDGYILLAEKAHSGDVYVQGSMRTNSVLTYILLTLDELGYKTKRIESIKGRERINDPLEKDRKGFFGFSFEKTKVDKLMLEEDLEFTLKHKGLILRTQKKEIKVLFDPNRFRPADVPILMSDTRKIQRLGFNVKRNLKDIIKDQISYYLNPDNRHFNVFSYK